jgi:hypothetical protein
MQITVKKDEESNQHYFDIEDFKDILDIDIVEFYKLETDDECLKITFYDINKNIVLPKLNK